MAAYEFLAAEPTIKVLSPEYVQDAQRVTARAIQSGIVFSEVFAPYPLTVQGTVLWTPEAIASELAHQAGIWDQNAQVPGVLGIGITQSVDAAGSLRDVALVTVASTSGRSTTQIELGPREWLPSVAGTTLTRSFGDAVAAARAQLDEVETSGVAGGGSLGGE